MNKPFSEKSETERAKILQNLDKILQELKEFAESNYPGLFESIQKKYEDTNETIQE